MASITLGGREYPVQPPASFAEREDAVVAWSEADTSAKTRRAFGASIGLCCPAIAKAAGASYAAHGYDAMKFGEAVYNHLRTLGVKVPEISDGAHACLDLCMGARAPREEEVKSTADFTGPGGAPSTATP
jgi:hypothetical protein